MSETKKAWRRLRKMVKDARKESMKKDALIEDAIRGLEMKEKIEKQLKEVKPW